jgi:hypothetical protein
VAKQFLRFDSYTIFKYLAFIICAITIFVFFFSAGPVQDDYSLLADVSEIGLLQYLTLVWNSHGGNLTPMLLNFLAGSSAIDSFNFISFSLFSISTIAFVSITIILFLNKLLINGVPISPALKFSISVGTILGFEGLFSPGLIGAYSFTSAAAVHLWPVLLTFTAYFLARSHSRMYLLLFFVGFFAGNSNIAESLAILLLLLLLYFFPQKFDVAVPQSKLIAFFSGAFLGTLAIVISPGFWFRATEKTTQGMPSSITDALSRLFQSTTIFSFDILTHPTFYIFLVAGIVFAKSASQLSDIPPRWNFVELFFWCLFVSLIFGATFAYPAWHQSLGLLFLIPIFSFFSGVRLAKFTRLKQFRWIRVFQVFMVVLLVISVARANILVWDSGRDWHQANAVNICSLRVDSSALVSNPEIHYPPFSLGIEGSQSWTWIRDAYTRWLSNMTPATTLECD